MEKLELPRKIRRALKKLRRDIVKVLDENVEVYLFGSYARGDWLEDSDLDLIVVSDKFKGLSLGERYCLVRKLLPNNISVEILPYTPEEFKKAKKKSIVLKDALEYWVRIL